jgi:hypothetical protein
MPLASVQLPVIASFPNARILFARRDPRDVVLSCPPPVCDEPFDVSVLTLVGGAITTR